MKRTALAALAGSAALSLATTAAAGRIVYGYPLATRCPAAGIAKTVDRWGMFACNCTSYVAWALTANGQRTDWFVPGSMDAWNWPNVARCAHLAIGHGAAGRSSRGLARTRPPFGHVAYVTAVGPGGRFAWPSTTSPRTRRGVCVRRANERRVGRGHLHLRSRRRLADHELAHRRRPGGRRRSPPTRYADVRPTLTAAASRHGHRSADGCDASTGIDALDVRPRLDAAHEVDGCRRARRRSRARSELRDARAAGRDPSSARMRRRPTDGPFAVTPPAITSSPLTAATAG